MTRDLHGLALVKYDDQAASTRQRFLAFRPGLAEAGITFDLAPFLDNAYLDAVLNGKAASLGAKASGYLRRLKQLRMARGYDFIWLQYEVFPYLPAMIDLGLLPRKTALISDYDDAFHSQYLTHSNPVIRAVCGPKIAKVQARSGLVICGNQALVDYASAQGAQTALIPTCLDTDRYCPVPKPAKGPLRIGWIGSPTTLPFLQEIYPALDRVVAQQAAEIHIIGGHGGEETRQGFHFHRWSEDTEIPLLQGLDIGIMPLPDTDWARGKSGYKLIQYMALGLPVIAAPIGANTQIVEDRENGLFASSLDDWVAAITRLGADPEMRATFGKKGRAKVLRDYAVAANVPKLAQAIRSCAET